MKVMNLSQEEQVQHQGADTLVEISYADLTSTGNTQTLSPISLPINTGFQLLKMELAKAFVSSNAALVSTTISVGDGNSATRFLAATEVNDAATEVVLASGTAGLYLYTVADTVDVFVTGTAAQALTTFTAGLFRLYGKVTTVNPVNGSQPANYPSL
jgi:hypothetical protein